MRHSYTLFIYTLLAVFSLTACKDDFDIDKVKSTPKLILYCMPTATWATDRIRPWHTNRSETA